MAHGIIIGGGVIGLLTAWHLRQSGHDITLLEQAQIGQASSWAGGGIISPLYPWRYDDAVTALAQYSQRHYPKFCQQLAETTGIDPELTPNGLLITDVASMEQATQWAQHFGYLYERVNRDDIEQLNPRIGSELHHGLWFPDIAQVRNPRLVKALKAANAAQGVHLLEQHAVTGFIQNDDEVIGVGTNEGDLLADFTVLCSGAWSGQLIDLPVKPIQGQMLLYQTQPDWLKQIVLHKDRYLIPRRDGHVLIGSTMEDVGFDKQTSASAFQDLEQAAQAILPEIKQFPIVKHWAGLRPATEHGIPFIGEHEQYRNLYLNTGHFRNGIVLGLASAKLCSDLINKKAPEINPGPYAFQSKH